MSRCVVPSGKGRICHQVGRTRVLTAGMMTLLFILHLAVGGCANRDDKIARLENQLTVHRQGFPELQDDPCDAPVRTFEDKAASGIERKMGPYAFSLPEGWTFASVSCDGPHALLARFTLEDQVLQIVTFEVPACQLYREDWIESAQDYGVNWPEVSRKYETDRAFWTAVMKTTPGDVDLDKARAGHLQEAREKLWMIWIKLSIVMKGDGIAWTSRFRNDSYNGLVHWGERRERDFCNVLAMMFTEDGNTDGELFMSAKTITPDTNKAMETVLATFRRVKSPPGEAQEENPDQKDGE